MAMQMATAGDDEADFLADPVDRFPLPDLAAGQPLVDYAMYKSMECEPAESSIGDVGDAPVNSNCGAIAPYAPVFEQSTGKPTPEAPGWTKRIRVGAASSERHPCVDRVSALEETLRRYAEKKTDTVIVPAMGTKFDSLGEAYDFYGVMLHTAPTDDLIKHLRQEMAYEALRLKGNRGDFPNNLYARILE